MAIFDWLARAVLTLASAAMIILVALMGYQVWGRYVMNNTPTWAENLALLLVLLVVLPVSAVGLRERFHLGITFFIELMSKRVQFLIEVCTTFLLGGFGALMAIYSSQLVAGTWGRKIPLLGIPQGMRYVPLVICGILIVIFMIERAIQLFTQSKQED